MIKLARALLAAWLLLLPLATACRVRAWRSDQSLWLAAREVPPVSRRTWGNLRRWDRVILIDEQPPARQPFSGRRRPHPCPPGYTGRGTWEVLDQDCGLEVANVR